ncbi:MAG: hypothetical protein EOP48_26450 [Sphingobacteriales bacterium]|nr:MAG: hypothetical protein EOP48_26450 [Sphingobacteriales bacterium]
MKNKPQELVDIESHPVYGGDLTLFGWNQDAYSDRQHATETYQALFVWRDEKNNVTSSECPSDFKSLKDDYTYLKWVSTISPAGECKSPTLGQFTAILKKVKRCLDKNNNINQ